MSGRVRLLLTLSFALGTSGTAGLIEHDRWHRLAFVAFAWLGWIVGLVFSGADGEHAG